MKREIKFRAWDNGKYWYTDDEAYVLKHIDGQLGLYEDANFYRETTMPDYVLISEDLEQYTGLKDKNRENANVFQGDIYKWVGLIFPITIDDYHGYRFMFGKDQLCRAFIVNGKYMGNIHE